MPSLQVFIAVNLSREPGNRSYGGDYVSPQPLAIDERFIMANPRQIPDFALAFEKNGFLVREPVLVVCVPSGGLEVRGHARTTPEILEACGWRKRQGVME
jgi:hypothetical protein